MASLLEHKGPRAPRVQRRAETGRNDDGQKDRGAIEGRVGVLERPLPDSYFVQCVQLLYQGPGVGATVEIDHVGCGVERLLAAECTIQSGRTGRWEARC